MQSTLRRKISLFLNGLSTVNGFFFRDIVNGIRIFLVNLINGLDDTSLLVSFYKLFATSGSPALYILESIVFIQTIELVATERDLNGLMDKIS